MSFIKKIKNIAPTVESLLLDAPECRDNDQLLVLKFWALQNPHLRDTSVSFVDFSHGFLNGSYCNPQTILRSRRKLQEKHPHLRGKMWYKRKKEETEVRKEIVNL